MESAFLQIDDLMNDFPALLASGGTEFDVDIKQLGRDFLREQRKNVKGALGISEGMGMDEFAADLVTDADLEIKTETVMSAPAPKAPEAMSARERAMMKRNARMQSQRTSQPQVISQSTPSASVDPFSRLAMASAEGPLSPLLSALQRLTVHSLWQSRHGALLGLKALIPLLDKATSSILCTRVAALLALDRFADYNGEQLMAPVREAAAQCLALLCRQAESTGPVIGFLRDMVEWPGAWQVRHAGLLAIRYLLPVCTQLGREEDVSQLLSLSEAALEEAEGDEDDDVRALAATLLASRPVYSDANRIFNILSDLDESSAAIGPLLDLLASVNHIELSTERTALLLGFVGSPSTAVRRTALSVLSRLTVRPDATVLRVAWQCLLLEEDHSALKLAESLIPAHSAFIPAHIKLFLQILCTPLSEPFDPRHFVFFRPGLGQCTSAPAHALGFKRADMMLLDPERLILGRRRAAIALRGQKIVLECTGDLSAMLSAWLQVENLTLPSSISLSGRAKTILLSACPVELQSTNKKFIIGALLSEPLSELRDDIAHGILSSGSLALPEDLSLLPNEDSSDPAILSILTVANDPWNAILHLIKGTALPSPLVLRLARILVGTQHAVDSQVLWSLLKDSLQAKVQSHDSAVACTATLFASEKCIESVRMGILSLLALDGLDPTRRPTCARLLSSIAIDSGSHVIRFAPVLLILALRWISDADANVRSAASPAFSALLPLISLQGTEPAPEIPADLKSLFADASDFLAQLLPMKSGADGRTADASAAQPYSLPIALSTSLRPYQQAGVSWLMFLRRYGLHGILADDMGLGKTLQTLCCLASDRWEREKRGHAVLPALVISPASLVGHWAHEAQLHCPDVYDENNVLVYIGPDRGKQLHRLQSAALIVTSYDVARNDHPILSSQHYSYLVLDEGHAIRNARTKTAQAIKSLAADHRLLLTGTPIQNAVLELWALFDFLMPGLLGVDEPTFMARYGKPIVAVQPSVMTTSSSSSSGASFEDAERALAALHRQVAPFLLRRMKSEVLQDLPPKIIQDLECEPSALQLRLLAAFEGRSGSIEEQEKGSKQSTSSFQALHYLRRLCLHPALVLESGDPDVKSLAASPHDLVHTPKLALLSQLLQDCGIIPDPLDEPSSAAGHRLLIFCQQRASLDLVERLVLRPHGLPHLRLDGSTDARQRHAIAARFNADPSIPVLLATTRVGGLGLNLTGADTVVFLEHDWNPQADLQAMDRAHRLGQKRSVTVYRLILRGTLEERVLGLQAWKKRLAAAVVRQQGEGQADTSAASVLDLLSATPTIEKPDKREKTKSEVVLPKWMAKAVDTITTAEEDSAAAEYEQEFDLDAFLTRLAS